MDFQSKASHHQSMNPSEICPTIGTSKEPMVFNLRGREGGAMPEMSDVASIRAASGGSSRSYVAASAVRRLTPRECERLQGFPDNYTLIPVNKKGKMAADGPRYKALGNSMNTDCMEWIGRRIQMVHDLPQTKD
jgi:DNA (cytosine-5)-methyltransferase 1